MAPRSLPPAKKRKTDRVSRPAEQIKHLENGLIEAAHGNESLNALPDLLDILTTTRDAQLVSKATYGLYRIFVVIITGGKLGLGGDEASKLVKTWLLDQLNVYVDFLCGLLKDGERTLRVSCRKRHSLFLPLPAEKLQTSALQILFSLQKHLSTSSKSQLQFHLFHFRKITSALLLCPPSLRLGSQAPHDQLLDFDIANLFHETWFSVYDDIRWFFLRESV